mmetsp:Transcript_3505/g.7901  ORF Transcript_3505/g.7901 Transcript_3505/m.7901 type:complete len:249 (+) Transcript_3505:40-786(+)
MSNLSICASPHSVVHGSVRRHNQARFHPHAGRDEEFLSIRRHAQLVDDLTAMRVTPLDAQVHAIATAPRGCCSRVTSSPHIPPVTARHGDPVNRVPLRDLVEGNDARHGEAQHVVVAHLQLESVDEHGGASEKSVEFDGIASEIHRLRGCPVLSPCAWKARPPVFTCCESRVCVRREHDAARVAGGCGTFVVTHLLRERTQDVRADRAERASCRHACGSSSVYERRDDEKRQEYGRRHPRRRPHVSCS